MNADTILNYVRIAESAAKILAIFVGGWWTYNIFLKKREKFPRACVSHEVETYCLTDTTRFVRVNARLENIGDTLIEVSSGEAWIQQILPTPKDIRRDIENKHAPIQAGQVEIAWPMLDDVRELNLEGNRGEIEPGEQEIYTFDFTIPENVEAVQVYSYFKNVKKTKREIGWRLTTISRIDKFPRLICSDKEAPVKDAKSGKEDRESGKKKKTHTENIVEDGQDSKEAGRGYRPEYRQSSPKLRPQRPFDDDDEESERG